MVVDPIGRLKATGSLIKKHLTINTFSKKINRNKGITTTRFIRLIYMMVSQCCRPLTWRNLSSLAKKKQIPSDGNMLSSLSLKYDKYYVERTNDVLKLFIYAKTHLLRFLKYYFTYRF